MKTMKPDPTRNARQTAYIAAQKLRKLVLVRVWVPADRVQAVKTFAKEQQA